MPKLRGSANSETKRTERRKEEEVYNPTANQSKVQKREYFIRNACYSVTKYYLCRQNNKRSLLGRIQRLEVVRSFPNRYQFSCINKVTSLFSGRYIFIIILPCNQGPFATQLSNCSRTACNLLQTSDLENEWKYVSRNLTGIVKNTGIRDFREHCRHRRE